MEPHVTVPPFSEPPTEPAGIQLTSKQRRFLAALHSERSVEHAAERANVSRTTAYRWLADPVFAAALKALEMEALEDTSRALVALSRRAIEVIDAILDDESATPATRLRAADTVLARLLQLREIVTLESRIEALEARHSRQDGGWR